nr:MAG TPA: hypothetical protein [Caudoviricetes sp.]
MNLLLSAILRLSDKKTIMRIEIYVLRRVGGLCDLTPRRQRALM